jgi:porin
LPVAAPRSGAFPMPKNSVPRLCLILLLAALASAVRAADSAPPAVAPPPAAETGWLAREHLTGDWGGLRDRAEAAGLTFNLAHTLDWSGGWRGSPDRRGALRGLFDLGAAWAPAGTGATFTAQYLMLRGRDASTPLGTLVTFSNIDDAPFAHWGELSWQQVFADGKLRLKLGQLDANSEFSMIGSALGFVNSAPAYSPTIFAMPTYPDPAPGINVFAKPHSWLDLGFGVYAGAAPRGLPGFAHPFLIGEAGVTHAALGRLAVGAWRVNGALARYDATTQPAAGGFYAVFERPVWRPASAPAGDPRGADVFAQFGTAGEQVSAIRRHLALGVSATGLFPGRDDDTCGLMVSVCATSRADPALTAAHETAIEAYYGWPVTGWLTLKADVQLIRHPGGSATRRDAVVGLLRAETTF